MSEPQPAVLTAGGGGKKKGGRRRRRNNKGRDGGGKKEGTAGASPAVPSVVGTSPVPAAATAAAGAQGTAPDSPVNPQTGSPPAALYAGGAATATATPTATEAAATAAAAAAATGGPPPPPRATLDFSPGRTGAVRRENRPPGGDGGGGGGPSRPPWSPPPPAGTAGDGPYVAGGEEPGSSLPGFLDGPESGGGGGKGGPFPGGGGEPEAGSRTTDVLWLAVCFLGIMGSFVIYGLLLEFTTSGGRKLHELSFLFVTSGLYTVTAAAGRYVRQETPTSIPPARFAVLGLTSMGSTFCSVRSLRYVIYPIQVLAKSCKPVPVMLMGALMGKRYPPRKYFNVFLIVSGVGLFMGGGSSGKKGGGGGGGEGGGAAEASAPSQAPGLVLLFVSLCFDGGTGAYEDKLMSVHSVGPFDLMYNIQLGKTILAGVGLLVLNQVHVFLQMCQDMGFLLVALGLSGALGQVFIFVTISKFGALTCSIIGLARKVTTLVASIYFYGHTVNGVQFTGLAVAVGSMVMNFWGRKEGKHGHGHGGGGGHGGKGHGEPTEEETRGMLGAEYSDDLAEDGDGGPPGGVDVEMGPLGGKAVE